MEMQEFSSPREEFSPVGQEFTSPAPEFSQPAPESRTAPEAHDAPEQTAAADAPARERKKRRVNPLMLTTAAVATAAVTLASVDIALPSFEQPSNPTITLSREHREYVDTLIAALDTQDWAQVRALEYDSRLPVLAKETCDFFGSFEASLRDVNYGLNRYTDENNFRIYATYHDGQLSYYDYGLMDAPDLQVDYSVYDSTGREYHHLCITDFFYGLETEHHTDRYFSSRRDENGSLVYEETGRVLYEIVIEPTSGERWAVPATGTHTTYHYYEGTVSFTYELSGTAFSQFEEQEDGRSLAVSYLENGTYTVTHSTPGQPDEVFVFEVVDGVTQPGDAEIIRQETSDKSHFALSVTLSDGTTYSPASGYAESEEDFLYHTFYFN